MHWCYMFNQMKASKKSILQMFNKCAIFALNLNYVEITAPHLFFERNKKIMQYQIAITELMDTFELGENMCSTFSEFPFLIFH